MKGKSYADGHRTLETVNWKRISSHLVNLEQRGEIKRSENSVFTAFFVVCGLRVMGSRAVG